MNQINGNISRLVHQSAIEFQGQRKMEELLKFADRLTKYEILVSLM
jgi:hypothetical protein